MRSPIRIASGQGFWGDWLSAPLLQVTRGPVDYLVMDYLAEVTMSILQKQRQRDPRLGYARDLLTVFRDIAPYLVERNVRLITNGGGVNPMAAAEELVKIAHSLGLRQLRIGVVLGDDLMPRIDKLLAAGYEFRHLETGQPLCEIRDRLLSANAYFGAFPIVEALRQGAQVVVTGRTTDTGITLAPMIYEFGWKENDYDLLAAG
ncbi:MAG: DUF1446 domain-containing protein, partial [Candidatus Kapabacteria bacterium]|nr:DUF1446 domain-containing protein [Candidatus Kapabacteria bacterium]